MAEQACPRCGYMMTPFDQQCPRCQRMASTACAVCGAVGVSGECEHCRREVCSRCLVSANPPRCS